MASRHGEPLGRAERKGASAFRAREELAQVSTRPFKVVGDDLVGFGGAIAPLVEPVGELFVEVGAPALRGGLVRRVAEQEMPEPVAVVSAPPCALGTDHVLADERGERRREATRVGSERGESVAVKDLPFHRRGLEQQPLVLAQLVEAGCEQRVDRRRDCLLVVCSEDRVGEFLREERVPVGFGDDLRPHLRRHVSPRPGEAGRDHLVDV